MTGPVDRRAMWDERHAARDPIEGHAPDPTLVVVAAGLPPARALDLGTGDGRNAVWLAERGWQVIAVDFSAVALGRASDRAAAAGLDVDWRLEDLLAWRPEEAAYELVALMFIHLPAAERVRVYDAACRAVAPGGTVLVVGHDLANLGRGMGGPQDPDVLFTPADVVAALPAGFQVVRAETVTRSEGDRVQLDAVVVARRPA
jgi:SAM-dependent methyltransferase